MGELLDLVRGKNSGPKSYVVVITASGKARLDKIDQTTDLRWQILNYLSENEPSPIRAISADLGIGEQQVKSACRRMADEGYVVQRSTSGGGIGGGGGIL